MEHFRFELFPLKLLKGRLWLFGSEHLLLYAGNHVARKEESCEVRPEV